MDPDEALADPLPHFLLSRVARVKAPVSLSNVVFSIFEQEMVEILQSPNFETLRLFKDFIQITGIETFRRSQKGQEAQDTFARCKFIATPTFRRCIWVSTDQRKRLIQSEEQLLKNAAQTYSRKGRQTKQRKKAKLKKNLSHHYRRRGSWVLK